MSNLKLDSEKFHQEIRAKALELDLLTEHQFVEEVGEILVAADEQDDFIRCSFQAKGIKIDGYYYDEESCNLNLIVSHWIDESNPSKSRVTPKEINDIFKRCETFFSKSLKQLFSKIEIANEAHDLAQMIYEIKEEITTVKIILITDGICPKRQAEIVEIDGVEVTRVIWDIERILKFSETGEKEPIIIDFNDKGGPITCLVEESIDKSYTVYLAYISGQTLADIYSQWGTRLLDMNVRVFLSARGNVNKGIRETIINNPQMFLAYNNGITVFASEIKKKNLSSNLIELSKATGLQVINGGQTVASLYHASRKQKAELSSIFVQMKLIVVNRREDIEALVPRISEYSNTQNKVSLADLSANEKPHPELHEISKGLMAPDPTGGARQTYWFYEKARGSYEETKNLEAKTPAKKRAFEALYPKNQRFDKSLFGQVWNTYLRKPFTVSQGAQKNFQDFNMWLKEQNEDLNAFFKKTVALILIWKLADRVVRKQKFEGYRHNIITYTLSWLFHLSEFKIDLDKIWKEQSVDDKIGDAIEQMSILVNNHIRNTDKNVTQWCKNKICWENLLRINYELPAGFEDVYISSSSQQQGYDSTIKAQSEVIEFCKSKGSQAWWDLAKWSKAHQFFTGKQRSQCANIGKCLQKGRVPSYWLAVACKKIWEDSKIRGWDSKENNNEN
jgi:hypothetical protein